MSIETLKGLLKENNIEFLENVSMKNHTTFKIGGSADLMVNVKNINEFKSAVKFAKAVSAPYFILGRGSNLLVSDNGIEGAVINTCAMEKIIVNGNEIICDAGVNLSKLCITAANNGLSGLEFAYGIPGTVGGALYMNAGAYDGEMSFVVLSAECLNEKGEVVTLLKSDMNLGYRTSIFKENKYPILNVKFKLFAGDTKEINAKMNTFIARRKEKQPLEYPSAGSTFKRPEGHFAGALIEENNLKGKTVGGAMVSEKHAGFIINYNNATADDVRNLINTVKQTVYENGGITLEPEVIFVGREMSE